MRQLGLLLFLCGTLLTPALGQPGTTTRISVSSSGEQGNNYGEWGVVSSSADGRYVAFVSHSSNLAQGDSNGVRDVFVRDRQTNQTSRVSVSSSGQQGDNASGYYGPAISASGRHVAFDSYASTLVPGDTNNLQDVFVRDQQTGQTSRVSMSSMGQQGNGVSYNPSISASGRYVAFASNASSLVMGDTNLQRDVFVRDMQTGQTTRVSISSSGQQGNNESDYPSISADGRYVAFLSLASNLEPGDTNAALDVFVHDRQTGETSRVSESSFGEQGNNRSLYFISISGDGRYVAFRSEASNLVPGDTNGFEDVFVRDTLTGETSRVSVSSSGEQGNGASYHPSISADGRYVAYFSIANNLAAGDMSTYDVFVRDRQNSLTSRVSVSSSGEPGNGPSYYAAISSDGAYVMFGSEASNLVSGDTNGFLDVFAHEYATEPNQPPVLASIPDATIAEEALFSYQLVATDPDLPVQTLTYYVASGAPTGLGVDPQTGLVTWTPTEAQGPGVYSVTAGVSDGWGGTDERTFTLTVLNVDKVISGRVDLQDYIGDVTAQPITFEIRSPGQTSALYVRIANPGPDGSYSFTINSAAIGTGLFDITAKGANWLRRLKGGVMIGSTGSPQVDFTGSSSLVNGDVDGDNEVGIGDYAQLSAAYNSSLGDPAWNAAADLNGDTSVDIGDYAILSQSYGLIGDD